MLSKVPVLCSRGLAVATAACSANQWPKSVLAQSACSLTNSRGFLTTSSLATLDSSSGPGLTEEQENMFALAREFAKEKMLPHAAAWEEDKASGYATRT